MRPLLSILFVNAERNKATYFGKVLDNLGIHGIFVKIMGEDFDVKLKNKKFSYLCERLI